MCLCLRRGQQSKDVTTSEFNSCTYRIAPPFSFVLNDDDHKLLSCSTKLLFQVYPRRNLDEDVLRDRIVWAMCSFPSSDYRVVLIHLHVCNKRIVIDPSSWRNVACENVCLSMISINRIVFQ